VSLINDALKRARHQALEQDADGKTVSYRAVPAHSRRAERPWMAYAIGGGTVALVMLGFMWMRGDPVTVAEPAADEAPVLGWVDPESPAGGQAAGSSEVSGVQDEAESEPDPVETLPESQPSARATSTPSAGVESNGSRLAEEEPVQVAEPVETPPVEQEAGARLEAGKTYLRRVVAMDGVDVVLGGIAYSESRPIAVMNGSVVTPGDMISGFTVIAITPEHVELEADGVKIFLALH
jgi:hypothetical protein